MRAKLSSKLVWSIGVIVALFASSTPFWLFSSTEQVTYEQVKQQRHAQKSAGASSSTLGAVPAGASALSDATNAADAPAPVPAPAQAPATLAATAPAPAQSAVQVAEPSLEELTATVENDNLTASTGESVPTPHNLPPFLSTRALIVFFGVSPQSPTAEELKELQEMDLDGLSGASSISPQDSLLTAEQLKNVGDETYEEVHKNIPASTYLAALLHQETSSPIFNIVTTTRYPRKIRELFNFVIQENKEQDLPELTDDNPLELTGVESIYLCYPVWWNEMPMAVRSFLQKYDLSGMTIIPVLLHSEPVNDNTLRTLASLEPNADIYKPPLAVSASQFQDLKGLHHQVQAYLEQLAANFN